MRHPVARDEARDEARGANMSAPPAAYRTSVLDSQRALAGSPAAWVNQLRRAALEQAHVLSLPTRQDEDWRFTDLSALYRLAFKPAGAPATLVAQAIDPYRIAEAPQRLVFIDGVYAPELSEVPPGEGLTVCSLAQVIAEPSHRLHESVRAHLGTLAPASGGAFAAINTAYLHHGAVLHVARNQAQLTPSHLLFITTREGLASYPRVLVIAEDGSQCHLVEDHVSLHQGAACVNAVTEVHIEANAQVSHARIQRDSRSSFHIARCAVSVARDARFESVSIDLGARLSRLDLSVRQEAPGVHIALDGLALVGNGQLADTHSFIDHAAAHGTSQQLHKTILSGASHAVFNGRILVRPGAQQTDSAQQSRNLLTSGRARVDAKPQLEINADDVKCAHGATVGQIDQGELFYLLSRGIAPEAARNLLTYGFAADIINRLGVASLAQRLRQQVLEQTDRVGSPS